MVIAILQNISLIILITMVYHYVIRDLRAKPLTVSIAGGLLFGSVSVLAMLSPVRFEAGIIYDGRTIILAIAGLFGGPLTTAIATLIASAFRIFYIGGPGALTGTATIVMAAAIGLGANYWRRKTGGELTFARLILIGLLVHIAMLAAQFMLPEQRWKLILPLITLPVLGFYPLAFYLVCMLFLDNEERAKDRSMLEESEARYRALFQNHRSTMLLMNPNSGIIIDANIEAEKFYGWPRERLVGMTLESLSASPPGEIEGRIKQALSSKDALFLCRHRLASGVVRNVDVAAGPFAYLGRTVLCLIVHDATARVEAENEVRALTQDLERKVAKRTQELEEANQALESFAYSVSHDLRAPLRALEGFSSLLEEEAAPALDDAARHYLDRIRRNAAKMSQLIDDLLRLSRVGRQSLDRVEIDFTAMARAVAEDIAAQYPGRTVSLRIQEGMAARADKALLEVALGNLLGNAWKFTSSSPGAVIKVQSVDSGGETIYSVADNGVGFDMAYSQKLFTPFQRLHDEREYAGSGIGLSLAQRIVARHGGKIWAQAEPGKGATFFFTLGG
ncbi:ATP-binding protein [bacterium]|nr:ATP-binding protein [bacterium]